MFFLAARRKLGSPLQTATSLWTLIWTKSFPSNYHLLSVSNFVLPLPTLIWLTGIPMRKISCAYLSHLNWNWVFQSSDGLFRLNDTERSFRLNGEPLCFENGLPVAELDGSIHDIFQNDAAVPDGLWCHRTVGTSCSFRCFGFADADVGGNDVIEEEEEYAAHFQENVEHIVSFKPNGLNHVSEYSYNSTVTMQTGKIVDQIWAGPSHWKLKYIRPSGRRKMN